MKLRLTAKSYNFKGNEYHKGDVLEIDSIEQIPVIFRQFFTIIENNETDEVTEIDNEVKSDTNVKNVKNVTNKTNKAKK